MFAHVRLKNEFTEDEKYHNLMSLFVRHKKLFKRVIMLLKLVITCAHKIRKGKKMVFLPGLMIQDEY